MATYNFTEIESKWRQQWQAQGTNRTGTDPNKPKFYALDMFPYPSGAGLHVGHPLGYIASDIVSRYKRLKGFNVLHPMGFDAFGLPAEQYAIATGQHPAVTTQQNLTRYKEQLQSIGLSFDWEREVKTSDPDYYKWTQWIFTLLFDSWYDTAAQKARPVQDLLAHLEAQGTEGLHAEVAEDTPALTAAQWQAMDHAAQQHYLLNYRLAYLSETTVNWCPELGTVLANEEVKDGLSERGGYPVERKKMMQWSLRITAYAERLLQDLNGIDWPEPIKEMQRNWIGKSMGAELNFTVAPDASRTTQELPAITVFTTRVDTVYGVTFLALAPESELVQQLTTPAQQKEVQAYVEVAKNRSERDRMSNVKRISGAFTGAYAIHPFSGEKLPIWVADYVLAGYGTGAVMAVPAHDSRDYAFAKHFELPIVQVVAGGNIEEEAYDAKEGEIINSDFMNGLEVKAAIAKGIEVLEAKGLGKGKVNYRLRDAIFSRQRYWGEPFPVYYKDGVPYMIGTDELPVELPEVDKYLPTATGEPPLGRARDWTYQGHPYELSTMPGWAGSSWYWFRYMDPHNEQAFVSPEAQQYWQNVDLYIGGAEHATGHLLYARFWTKFLFDRDQVTVQEPFKKLINQGMIQGRSNFVYRLKGTNTFVSLNQRQGHDTVPMHVDVDLVRNDVLDQEAFKQWRPDLADAQFVLEPDGNYMCGAEVEKMSKSKYNVVNPDKVIERYGADTLRLYEMFLGPLEQFKPWNTNGIDGVFKFLRKFWSLFHNGQEAWDVSQEAPTNEELKVLHRTLKKVEDDIERFSFNTTVSTFMIATNELQSLKCRKEAILAPLVIALAPYAPFVAEELWEKLGNKESVFEATFPAVDAQYLVDDTHTYPISINGKVRHKMTFALDASKEAIQEAVLNQEQVQRWTEGKTPKKVIIVPKRIVNIVV